MTVTSTSTYHRFNPLTRLVLAIVASTDAVLAGSLPAVFAILLLAVALPAFVAGRLGSVVRRTALLSAPLVLSAVLINGLFDPRAARAVGPFHPGWDGLALAELVSVRLLVLVGSAVLFLLTTRPFHLQLDLERRGLPARFAYLVSASVQALPEVASRAAQVRDAQRARGLDTSSPLPLRMTGARALAGSVVLGSLYASQERALALELRAFGHRAHRTLLWSPPDSRRQQLARWALALTIPALALLDRLGSTA